jgi:hypothetical protein
LRLEELRPSLPYFIIINYLTLLFVNRTDNPHKVSVVAAAGVPVPISNSPEPK